ncbi:hypothetical protein ADUPG1_011961, partial [Aduncisulcus paluster]
MEVTWREMVDGGIRETELCHLLYKSSKNDLESYGYVMRCTNCELSLGYRQSFSHRHLWKITQYKCPMCPSEVIYPLKLIKRGVGVVSYVYMYPLENLMIISSSKCDRDRLLSIYEGENLLSGDEDFDDFDDFGGFDGFEEEIHDECESHPSKGCEHSSRAVDVPIDS